MTESVNVLSLSKAIKNIGGEVLSCRYSQSQKIFAVGCHDGNIKIYQVKGGSDPIAVFKNESGKHATTGIRFNPLDDKQLLATYANGEVKRWHIQSSTCLKSLNLSESGGPESLLCLDYQKSGKLFAVGGAKSVVSVYDAETHQPLVACGPGVKRSLDSSLVAPEGHTSRVFSIKFHPSDPNLLVSGSWDNTVHFWDVRSSKPIRHLYGPFMAGDCLDVDPTGATFVTGSYRANDGLELWDFGSMKRIRVLSNSGDPCWFYSCQFMPNGTHVVACGTKANQVRLIELSTGNVVGRQEDSHAFYTFDLTRDGKQLIAGGPNKTQYLYNVTF